ncbi:acetoin utilization AcuB family protein [Bacillus sp. JNUCC-22]|uniref:acetoin utilization AcuB family protein n=1 Tax=unclassified Bacillus (in: firmicutes) TaxID=185979 RepID=UPI001C0A43A3|nr:acetoin utilization AcuB family protein [Bacillus sp. JNUCC-22]QWQ27390.1 acetoin utilization AcuB family protein [Bacillus sp. JNUCC-22]
MIAEQIMKRDVITVSKHDSIETAVRKMKVYHIRHLPVIDDELHVIGIVTDRDIKQAGPGSFEQKERGAFLTNKVETIMKRNVICAHPLDFVEEISASFYEHGIGCLPITVNHKLTGILTKTDVLRTFVSLTGAGQPGSQVEILVTDMTKSLADLSCMCRDLQLQILSVLVYPHDSAGSNILVFRVKTMNPLPFIRAVHEAGYNVLWPKHLRDQP